MHEIIKLVMRALRGRIRLALQAKEVMNEAERDSDSGSEEKINRNIIKSNSGTSTSPATVTMASTRF